MNLRRAKNEWQNDCGPVSMLKDSIQTCIVTFNTVRDIIRLRFNISVHKAAKLWNDVHLRIATLTRYSWYIAANKVAVF